MTDQTQRIEYVDLAKGFCILLVVIYHIAVYVPDTHFPGARVCQHFRMPLYFFLSGLFFKPYEGFCRLSGNSFLRRKVNKLLVPFLFFYLTTSVALPTLLHELFGVSGNSLFAFDSNTGGWARLYQPLLDEDYFNISSWFLLCLFFVNALFYGVYWLANQMARGGKAVALIGMFSLIIGGGGLFLSNKSINIRLFIDSAMTALPFYFAGFAIRKYTDILQPNRYDRYLPLAAVACFALLLLCHFHNDGPTLFRQNRFAGNHLLYLSGLIGTLGVMSLAKILGRVPVVSWWGRYSIIILVTQTALINLFTVALAHFGVGGNVAAAAILVLTLAQYFWLIPFCKRYLPWFVAQRDLV